MNDPFLPQDYQLPDKASGYMKLEQGENRFRVLAKPIFGMEWWTDTTEGGRKPNRVKMGEVMPASAQDWKHFWAMPVYNYKSQQIQILELTQVSILRTLKNLATDKDWGTPLDYDLVITRTGEGLDTEYLVTPKPKQDLPVEVYEKFEAANIDLEALYKGEDPFANSKPLVKGESKVTETAVPEAEVNLDDIPF